MQKEYGAFTSIGEYFLRSKIYKGFTLAEVLITLGIIGVVVALTLPILISNYRKKVNLVKIERTFTVLNNALNSAKLEYGNNVNDWEIPKNGTNLEKSIYFADHYLKPYLQVVDTCNIGSRKPYCRLTYNWLDGRSNFMAPVSSGYGTSFILNDGTVVYLAVGKGNGGENDDVNRIQITYDIDGVKGLNTLGSDSFIIELGGFEGPYKKNDADRNKFLPYLYNSNRPCDYYISNIGNACNNDAVWGGGMCLAYIMCNGWTYGDKYPKIR